MELSSRINTISANKDHGDLPCFGHLVTMEQKRRREEREHTIQKLESQEMMTTREKQWLRRAKNLNLRPRSTEPRRELKLNIKFSGKGEFKSGKFNLSVETKNNRRSVMSLTNMDFPTVLGTLENLKLKCKNSEKEIKKMKKDNKGRLLQEENNNLLNLQFKLKKVIQFLTSILSSVQNSFEDFEQIDFHFTDFYMLVRSLDSTRKTIVTKTMEQIQKIPVTRK